MRYIGVVLVWLVAAMGCMAQQLQGGAAAEQDAEKARALLKNVKEQLSAKVGLDVEFSLVVDNLQTKQKQTYEGTLQLLEQMYILKILGSETYFDGTTLYTYSEQNNEVVLTAPEEGDQGFVTPAQILGAYEDGYRIRYLGVAMIDGIRQEEVDMYPSDRKSNIVRLRVTVNARNGKVVKLVQQTKDGILMTYSLKNMVANRHLSAADFRFDSAKKSGVQVVDMR